MSRTFSSADPVERERGLTMAVSVVRRGGVVVIPTEHAYAVACDAFAERGTTRVREAKRRSDAIALPVLVASIATLDGILRTVTPELKALATACWPGPLTIVARAAPSLTWELGTPGLVSVRVPLHPVALELVRRTGPMAAIAANATGQPPPTSCSAALEQLTDVVEVGLDAGERPSGAPSSIVDVTGEVPVLLRQGAFTLDALRAIVPSMVAAS